MSEQQNSGEPLVLVEHPRPNVALVTLNRAERMNSMAFDVMLPLKKVLDELTHDNDVRVVVLTGAGRGFSSGADHESAGSVPHVDGLTRPTFALRSMEVLDDVILAIRKLHQRSSPRSTVRRSAVACVWHWRATSGLPPSVPTSARQASTTG